MKFRDNLNGQEVEATQYLGDDEDPRWRERLLDISPELRPSSNPHHCRNDVCPADGRVLIRLNGYLREVFPTNWIVTGSRLGSYEIFDDPRFRSNFEPANDGEITGQREFVFEGGEN